jgi:putative DNA primase/helicase
MPFQEWTIPSSLRNSPQWVCYKKGETAGGHMGKTMYSPNTKKPARSNEPLDWSTFFLADMMRIERKMDGLAYVLTSGIVFIDVDGCFDKYGTVSPLAQELMDEFPGAYAERSCSGSGLHIFVKGSLPENSMKRNDVIGLEMYDTKRFCCLTGDSLPGRTEIIDYSSKISDVASRYLGIKKPLPIITSPASLPIPDGEVIRKASTAKNGRKFLQLYSGDLSGYPSHSNADMALCNILAYWCSGPEQIDRIFRSSGLMRDKWDSPRGKSTYGFTTIEAAMSMRVIGPSTEAS